MKRMMLLLTLLASGCSEGELVGVYAPGNQDGVIAAADLGLPVFVSTDANARIRITETDDVENGDDGHAIDKTGCHREAEIRPGMPPEAVAHEIGHILGLDHIGDEDNLMFEVLGVNPELRTWQIEKAQAAANLMVLCW